ncbi:MAG: gamma-glutamyltransferase, partial [Planctomycetota bacterium]
LLGQDPPAEGDPNSPQYAVGTKFAATSTSRQATEAALWALEQGGNAADAYLTAALTQTVAEPGLTTLGGALSLTFFNAASGKTEYVVGRLGPAEAEPYDFERFDKVSLTGKAMAVPGFLAGCWKAHEKFGSLPWSKLFEPAIRHAVEGIAVQESILRSARRQGSRLPEGKALWTKNGNFLQPGERFVQTALGRTLKESAENGPEAFYEGDFGRDFVKRCKRDGGRMTLKDLQRWRDLVRTRTCELEGSYRGHTICAPGAGLLTYALHLNEAVDLRSTGSAHKSPHSLFRQVRIMEDLFHSKKDYSKETHSRFVSPQYARDRVPFVLHGPLRDVRIDDLFHTCFLVIRDARGNCAWGTHSINTPQAFGAGIVVRGVYAAYAMNRAHVKGGGATASGISTCFALYRDNKPRLIVGSPGFGFVHGPYQWCSYLMEWGLSPWQATWSPRFGLPASLGSNRGRFESYYKPAIFDLLRSREISHERIRPSPATGLVGALWIDEKDLLHITQDPRRKGGLASAGP